MGRKGKINVKAKGLKGSLIRYQTTEKLHSKLKQKHEHLQKKEKSIKNSGGSKNGKKPLKSKFIPFDKDSTLLLIGEGDFSYARSIIEEEYIMPENLIVTSFEKDLEQLVNKYPTTGDDNYKFLLSVGTKVFFNVDATNLIKSLNLSERTPWAKLLGREWDLKPLNNIMFNFPHGGYKIKDQLRNIMMHQNLVFKYFINCQQLLSLVNKSVSAKSNRCMAGYDLERESERRTARNIILALFSGEPYDSWEIKRLARKAGLRLERSNKFEWENYPRYHHRRTNGENDTTKPAAERDARIYIFEEFIEDEESQS
ncbi:HDL213Wp [Eremothecium sinecaudum]|uniref:HDL213Wp n=1 Tax=Eremothecium sinecaudum TaxID=45286 RepID=A0A0X8HR99_9SACH|nr:HDL213Wp [Eremothecium sinecaudum]AMD20531.1 HDL213Wp [Eremothecium sinecaudum]